MSRDPLPPEIRAARREVLALEAALRPHYAGERVIVWRERDELIARRELAEARFDALVRAAPPEVQAAAWAERDRELF